jgi:hypothetical protein
MIAEIGIMIAAYIVTKMMAVLGQRLDANTEIAFWQVLTKIGAGLTIFVAILVAVDLLTRGGSGNYFPEGQP